MSDIVTMYHLLVDVEKGPILRSELRRNNNYTDALINGLVDSDYFAENNGVVESTPKITHTLAILRELMDVGEVAYRREHNIPLRQDFSHGSNGGVGADFGYCDDDPLAPDGSK